MDKTVQKELYVGEKSHWNILIPRVFEKRSFVFREWNWGFEVVIFVNCEKESERKKCKAHEKCENKVEQIFSVEWKCVSQLETEWEWNEDEVWSN